MVDYEEVYNMEYIIDRNEKHLSKIEECEKFFEELINELGDEYELIPCKLGKTRSSYLVPKGKANEITYYSKPNKSFRIANCWNWYTNYELCDDEWHVQCLNYDLPFTRDRKEKGKGGRPIKAMQVAYKDGEAYHCVYGEKYDRKTHRWSWVRNDPKTVAESILRG